MKENLKRAEEALKHKSKNINTRYRLGYHIMAPANWINDPNGLCYFNGKYHVFYQHNPYSEKWGPMYWGHVTSDDLVRWKYEPIALAPSKKFDEDGCFSGTAAVDPGDGKLILAYTGHRWIDKEKDFFEQSQCLAYSYDGINFEKEEGRINIEIPSDSSHHIRDPKLWFFNGTWYMLLGNSTIDREGRVILYQSKNLKDWSFKSILARSNGEMGYMFECPDFFRIENVHVLIFSPQGMEVKDERYKNFNQSGYLIGEFNYEDGVFKHNSFQELDYGHDFYAPQTLIDHKGRRILIAWMDMWESIMPSQEDGWSGAMTLPRELILKEDRLIMKPIDELISLREKVILSKDNFKIEESEELPWIDFMEMEFSLNILENLNKKLNLTFISKGNEKVEFIVDLVEGSLILNRDYITKGIKEDYRKVYFNVEKVLNDILNIRIFLDKSSIEVFVNDGEYVFTSRIYPEIEKYTVLLGKKFSLKNFNLFKLKDYICSTGKSSSKRD